ncbi:ABC transporter ATP-binding protein [Azospirillum griseum]|uniref:ABC transporter ATP-binding protein n=1 Tax=Azospirillum griseum TaxID=2496639 RepID=A0A3S0I1A4_9PROT|nr:ABC transporter ATP-binding protein [Azospirillum griseum]RTR20598.1 ABC transporter ATP-binding protein [Azospirillum griseum]
MSDAMLEMTGIVRRFEQGGAVLEVLRGADLTVRAGELVALVGPSGAGKSTLLQIAGLLERPTAGVVRVAGADVSDADDATRTAIRRRSIGFVYQFHHLLPEFTAQENIVLPQMIAGVAKRVARQRADDLLRMVGLDARGSHRPARLSGGEQQRVAIARALANAPSLLVADEPTGNLDPHTAEAVFAMLSAIVRQARVGALVATHNMELARRMDRILEMRDGLLVEHAPV